MASFTYDFDINPFPDGTVVGAYVRDRFLVFPPSGAPPGAAVSTATVANSRVTLSQLNPGGLFLAAPTVPATTVAYANPYPFDVSLNIVNNSNSSTLLDGTIVTATPTMLRLPRGSSITFTYVGTAPTWKWMRG